MRPISFLLASFLILALSLNPLQSNEQGTGLSLPAEAKSEVGRLVKLTVVSTTEVYWDVDDNLAKPEDYYIDSQGKTIILPCPKEGTYKVKVFSVIGGKLQVKSCLVTIGKTGEVAATTSNKPDKKPPSELVTKLEASYKQDIANRKGTPDDLRKMAQVYKQGHFLARNVRNKSGDEVFAGLRQMASSVKLDDNVLPLLRQSVAEVVAAKVTWELEKEMTPQQRDILATSFLQVYKSLEAVQ